MTYFTIEYSFYLTVLTYGLVFGSGVGIAYSMPLSCGMRVGAHLLFVPLFPLGKSESVFFFKSALVSHFTYKY